MIASWVPPELATTIVSPYARSVSRGHIATPHDALSRIADEHDRSPANQCPRQIGDTEADVDDAAGVVRVDRDGVVRLRAEQDGLLDLGRRLVVLHRLQGHGDRGGLPHPVPRIDREPDDREEPTRGRGAHQHRVDEVERIRERRRTAHQRVAGLRRLAGGSADGPADPLDAGLLRPGHVDGDVLPRRPDRARRRLQQVDPQGVDVLQEDEQRVHREIPRAVGRAADDADAAARPRAGVDLLLERDARDRAREYRVGLIDIAAAVGELDVLEPEVVGGGDAEVEPVLDVLRVGAGQLDGRRYEVALHAPRVVRRLARPEGAQQGAHPPQQTSPASLPHIRLPVYFPVLGATRSSLMCGVTRINRSRRVSVCELNPNSLPMIGRSTRNGIPVFTTLTDVTVRPPITAVSPSLTRIWLSACCVWNVKPMSTDDGFTAEFSACTSMSTWRLAVTCGVTFRLMPVCSNRTVARGGAFPPLAELTSITRIGTRSPTRISAGRLSRVVIVGSACRSASSTRCSACRNVDRFKLPMAVEKIRFSAGLTIS